MSRFRTGCLWFTLAVATAFATDIPGVWVDVPFIPQEKNGCGAASIAMIMRYWEMQQGRSPAADAESIQRELYSRPAHGIYASDLENYLDRQGFRTFALRGDWNDLKQHLSKGRPLIVALAPSSLGGPLHYVVVAGVDEQQGVVMLNDPAQRKLLKESRSNFERQWSAAGKWTLLAVPGSVAR
ncbi:MAG TPA: C39 family peptidase [Terriglobales bacterium]|nr:C39 family peptidase [Terriglobales bacterium]